MSLNLLKYIGLGILGLGGISSVAALSSRRVREFIGLSSPLTEEDRQGQFLYELSKKVFRFLKDKKKGGADQKENVVKGLKDKFNGSLENEEDTWENFKSLCEVQKSKETKGAPDVDNEYSRLCFLDVDEENPEDDSQIKGGLFNGGLKLGYCEFHSGLKGNFGLGTKLQKTYPGSNPSDVFDNGLSTNPEQMKDFLDEAGSSDLIDDSCEDSKK